MKASCSLGKTSGEVSKGGGNESRRITKMAYNIVLVRKAKTETKSLHGVLRSHLPQVLGSWSGRMLRVSVQNAEDVM